MRDRGKNIMEKETETGRDAFQERQQEYESGGM